MKNIISVATCIEIYNAHREIEAADNLIAQIDTREDEWSRAAGEYLPRGNGPLDGERHSLTLSSATFSSSKTIANVSPKLARYIILAHADEARKKLSEACLRAKMELDGILPEPTPAAASLPDNEVTG